MENLSCIKLKVVLFLSCREVGVRLDGRVHLTVVYFGTEQMTEVKAILEYMSR